MVSVCKVVLIVFKSFVEEWTLDISFDELFLFEGVLMLLVFVKGLRDECVLGFM